MAETQARHDEQLLDEPGARAAARRLPAQRGREPRADTGHDQPSWKVQFEAHRRELHELKEQLARLRDEIEAQARRPVDEAKAAKTRAKAQVKASLKGSRGGR